MGPKLCHNYTNQSSSEPLAQVSFDCLSVKMAMPTAEVTAKVPVMLCPAFHGKCCQVCKTPDLFSCLKGVRENDLFFPWEEQVFWVVQVLWGDVCVVPGW